ncbi:hypothetical protein F5Y09DRAFT_344946 [Xylaria sp. FL1042]|nr:hypothetical protein F5Y09DRAFT_344946 [Xylaria sp. FL1042]
MSITFNLPSTQVWDEDLYRLVVIIDDDGLVGWDSLRYLHIELWNTDGRATSRSIITRWSAEGSRWRTVWPSQWFMGLEMNESYYFLVSLRTRRKSGTGYD